MAAPNQLITPGSPKYKRIVLKLSGEAFSGGADFGIDPSVSTRVARQIKCVSEMGVEVGIVVGGGNIWRGAQAEEQGMDRATADYAGMLEPNPISGEELSGTLRKAE